MKNIINWKLFFVLLAACVIVTLLVMPFTLALSPNLTKIFTPTVFAAQIIQAFILFSVAIFFGLLLAKHCGFGLPIVEGLLKREYQGGHLKSILPLSVGMGILGAILIILFSLFFMPLSITLLKSEISVAAWKGFLASFYGGIAEEIMFRLFLMSLFVWILSKIRKKQDGHPASIDIWLSIVLSSILFGLGHLGITKELVAITSSVVFRAILLNSVSVVFGWLYWKKGLESAMIAHFSSDIILHVITPLIASLFI